MKTEIVVAIIGAIAAIGAAFITATMTAEKTATETAKQETQEVRQQVSDTKNAVENAAQEVKAVETRVVSKVTTEIVKRIEKLDVVTAGAVKKDGAVVRHAGYPFTGSPRQSGIYRVNFRDPFKEVPVVVAISDGGDKGAFAEVTSIDATGFTVEGRTYSGHGLAPIGFQFVAVQAVNN